MGHRQDSLNCFHLLSCCLPRRGKCACKIETRSCKAVSRAATTGHSEKKMTGSRAMQMAKRQGPELIAGLTKGVLLVEVLSRR